VPPAKPIQWRRPVILALVGLCVVAFLFSCMGGFGDGSRAEAARLRPVVAAVRDPESGRGIDPEYFAKRFPNGEWIVGISRDSHAPFNLRGGTAVTKDSRGQVRCFFGHVCGPRGFEFLFADARTLDEAYREITVTCHRTEYEWPTHQ
jgi:hypothetical protein